MNELAIRVSGLGKEYRIGDLKDTNKTLRESLVDAFSAPIHRTRSLLRGQAYGAAGLEQSIWALKDISFEVMHGEVLGIIGHNGAGKSTLLKILSRITEPTEGVADIYGRVGALLEVGTGFHMELTGRENVYLNGAILGMTRAEINQRFDEIVEFSGVERFVDTPLKHYSTGMKLRLGFAVAAHLEPEILVIDEVLAVGDAEFQRKCLGKMEDVARGGRTVLFVSHNMAAVQSLCDRAILLRNGHIEKTGDVSDVIAHYMSSSARIQSVPLFERTDRWGNGHARFTNFYMLNDRNEPTDIVQCGAPVKFVVEYASASDTPLPAGHVSFVLKDMYGTRILGCSTTYNPPVGDFDMLPPQGKLVCSLPEIPLAPGTYYLQLHLSVANSRADQIDNVMEIVITEGDFFGTGKLPDMRKQGVFFVHHDWVFMDSRESGPENALETALK